MFVWGKVKNEIMDNEKSKTEKIYLFIVGLLCSEKLGK